MTIALGALTLLQLVAGSLLARATSTVDRLAGQVATLTSDAAAERVKLAKAEEEVERLRDWRHTEVNREQADMADRELRRLLLEELRALRGERRGAA